MIYLLLLSVITIGLSVILVEFYNERKKINKISKQIPGPKPNFILGLLLRIPHEPAKIFKEFMSYPGIYGPNVFIRGLFNHTNIMVSRSEDLETILNSKSASATIKGDIYSFLQPWLGDGLLLSSGDKHHTRRKILTPSFHFTILEKFIDIFNRNDEKLIRKLGDGGELNIYELLTLCALDNICEAAMGVQINAMDNSETKYIKAVKGMSQIIFDRVFCVLHQFPTLWSWLYPASYRQTKLLKILHDFTDNVIKTRRATIDNNSNSNGLGVIQEKDDFEVKRRFSLLDMLLNVQLSDMDIREEVDTFMFEGHDTTTSGLTFAIYHLAKNLDIQEKVHEEIESIMGQDKSTPVTYNQLKDMKYMEMVIKEVMRLHPPVPIIMRKVIKPFKINGVELPVGTNLTLPIFAIHRDPNVFPSAEKFDPMRFTEEEQSKRNPFSYIAFSAGLRNCIGQRFAMLEMKSVLSSIVRNYKILPTKKIENMDYHCDIILRPIGGMHVKLVKRSDN